MKFFRGIILYGTLVLSLYLLWDGVLRNPCYGVIEYDIGVFDDRFGIDRDTFLDSLARAEETWESVAGRELFTYTSGSDFKVNLIYSDEQERIHQGNDLTEKLDDKGTSLEDLSSQYDVVLAEYKRSVAAYESQVAAYEHDVDFWNNQGGAPQDEYATLQKRAGNLDAKFTEVNRLRTRVNALAQQANDQVDAYNDTVNVYNELFSESHEFHAGDTDGTEINVYTYDGFAELHALLVHEFGHVLGIDHLENPESVMYYLLNDKNTLGALSSEDVLALQDICRIN